MNIHTTTRVLALSLAALSCSARTLDLDAPAIEASNEPGVLGIVREEIEKIAVDEQRLYWVGRLLTPLANDDQPAWFLQSCQKRDCAGTLVTYGSQPQLYERTSPFSVQGGQIYWYRWGTRELVACPVAGCAGPPRTVASGLGFGVAEFGDGRFYFTQSDGPNWNLDSLWSITLERPEPQTVLASSRSTVFQIVVVDAYAYWIESSGQPKSALLRTRKDGTSGIETISDDVKLAWSHDFDVTTDTTAIYWTENLLYGSINRCPLTGCTTTHDVVVTSLRVPQKLLIDGSELYYLYEEQPFQLALAHCSLPACAEPALLVEGLDKTSMATDDQYLYLAANEPVGDGNAVARIRRLAKPTQELP